MSPDEFVRFLAESVWLKWFEESGKVWRTFRNTLGSIWRVDLIDVAFLLTGPVGAIIQLNQRVVDSVDAFVEFRQDLALVPARIAADVADDAIPVPDAWKNRVVTADQMIRFLVTEGLTFAINIFDADLPQEFTIQKQIVQGEIVRDALAPIERVPDSDILNRTKTAAKSAVALALLNIIKTAMGWGVVLWVAWIVRRVHDPVEGPKILEERSLFQDSRRVRRRKSKAFQFRINRQRGTDK